jgi:hypothetical protein
MTKEKIKNVLPGDSTPLDTTIKTKHPVSAFVIGLLIAFITTSMLFLMLCKSYPFPTEKTPLQQLGHYWNFIFGIISQKFQSDGFGYNAYLLSRSVKENVGTDIVYRWIGSLILGIVFGIYVGIKSNVAIGGIFHVKGRKLLKDLEAYFELKYIFTKACGKTNGSRLILAVDPGIKFDPRTQTIDDLKPGTYLEKPESLETQHTIVVAGTNRGKTQFAQYSKISQLYTRIKRKEKNLKLLLLDTPKLDYSRVIHPKLAYSIGPHISGSIPWWIAKDLNNRTTAKDFWKGQIPVKEGEPWGHSAISIGTGLTFYLQVMAPHQWNTGMLVYMLGKPAEEIAPILLEYHPEANQILRSADVTLSGVMFNLGTYSESLLELARIWDGFDIKKLICQATTGALRNPKYIDFVKKEMQNAMTLNTEEKEKFLWDNNGTLEDDSKRTGILFEAACTYLNNTNKKWVWKDFSKVIEKPFLEHKDLITTLVKSMDKNLVHLFATPPSQWVKLCSYIHHYSEEWDNFESAEKLSIGDWLVNENPDRKILILKPSARNPSLTTGLIRGILYYANKSILGDLNDNSERAENDTRKFHIVMDEFNSIGNVKEFVNDTLAMYRSKGISATVLMQDIAQAEETYGAMFAQFLTSNTGNIVILGVNAGDTAKKISDMVGKRTIRKLHKSDSYGAGGKSSSHDFQDHDEDVISPDEINSLLGVNQATKMMTYLYIGSGIANAYLLQAPTMGYTKDKGPKGLGYESVTCDFLSQPYQEPNAPGIEKLWNPVNLQKDREIKLPTEE